MGPGLCFTHAQVFARLPLRDIQSMAGLRESAMGPTPSEATKWWKDVFFRGVIDRCDLQETLQLSLT